jgi:lipopolysaccharide transport system permease protein
MAQDLDSMPITWIDADRPDRFYWRDLWRYRELLYFLAWRDILLRYKQTVVGVVWALLPPLVTVGVFSLVFGRFARMPSVGVPYPILVMVGTLPWNLFANVLSQGGNSVVANGSLISKVYFPRLIIPLSALVVSLVDFCIAAALLAVLMLYYHLMPNWRIITLPFFIGVALLTAFGAGAWLAALNARYRDFRYVIPFLIQLGLYISPVGFATSIVPERWRMLYSLNPMVGVINGFRWAILGRPLYAPGFCLSLALMVLLLGVGLRYFQRVEGTLADVI